MITFFNDKSGAVTVFVTLLLIPAMLVSGTAVDLARIHTAKSIVHDANQLAANSVLTQYDALIKDIYGLYGVDIYGIYDVMEEDPILAEMLNEYIEAAIFGKDNNDKGLGTFQLFYGSNLQPASLTPIENKNLGDPNVLRRQIEEYAKFRAPVIVMREVLAFIEGFKKLKDDTEAINMKMDIDDRIEKIDRIYEKIYDLINEINEYPADEKKAFDYINKELKEINNKVKTLKDLRKEWEDIYYSEDYDDETDLIEQLDKLEDEYNDIKKDIEESIGSLMEGISGNKSKLKEYIVLLENLIEMCGEADNKKNELSEKIDELETKLKDGSCSQELVDGMTKVPEGGNREKKSMIDEYKDLFRYELKPMAETMKEKNEKHIGDAIKTIDNLQISLKPFRSLSFTIEDADNTALEELFKITKSSYCGSNEFIEFRDISEESEKFYEELDELYSGTSNLEKDKQKGKLRDALKGIQELLKDAFEPELFDIDGAQYYKSNNNDVEEPGIGSEGDWGKEGEASKQTRKALNDNIIDKLGNMADNIANMALLLVYSTEMFSNYTTEPGTKTMSGVSMGTDVNYFFQSELEYVFNGNQNNAKANVATVCSMIFLVRFVFNYISTFIIPRIQDELIKISAIGGPYAITVRELARVAYTLGESTIDMNYLTKKPSEAVALFKIDISQWKFSLSSIINNVAKSAQNGAKDEIKRVSLEKSSDADLKKDDKESRGFKYIDYVRIFLLFRTDDVIAQRTADLIGWNITNKKNGINADEEKMSKTDLIKMENFHTDFEIKTTVDLRMLFLSMPFAQKGVNKVIPPKTVEITATDYRGY